MALAVAAALAIGCGCDARDPDAPHADSPASVDPAPTEAPREPSGERRAKRDWRAPRSDRGVHLEEPGRFRRYRTHRFDEDLDPEQRAIIEQLEALGYASGSVAARGHSGITIHDRERAWAGYNFYTSGHAPEALLADMDGQVLHRWSKEFRDVWPDYPIDDSSVKSQFWRRAHLYPNGDLLAIFGGLGIVKLDKDSNILWEDPGRQHHDVFVAENGDLYLLTREAHVVPRVDPKLPILEDFIAIFDSEGREKYRLSLLEAFERSGSDEIWPTRRSREKDIFHTNSIEVLDGRLAHRLPTFRKGNVLTSMRALDAIAVIDLDQRKAVWWHFGEYALQHDPKILDGGTLLLFDNQGREGESAVLEYAPETMEVVWSYRGSANEPFFTRSCGTAQRLPNGNTLITESDNGRAFEVTPEHEIVWEFVNPHRAGDDGEFIATLFEMLRLPPDFPIDWADAATRASLGSGSSLSAGSGSR